MHRWGPIVWRLHQCAHDVLNNSSCLWIWLIHVMDQLHKWHLGWIVHKILCILIFTPYDNCQLAHQICFRLQSCLMLFGHWSKGLCSFQFTINNKQLWGHPPMHFPCVYGILLLSKPIYDNVTSCKHPTLPQLQITMYTTSSLFNGKCNIMLSLDKSFCKKFKWCITFIMFTNAHVNFTQFCL
jgi:hypothetical protein